MTDAQAAPFQYHQTARWVRLRTAFGWPVGEGWLWTCCATDGHKL